VVPPVPPVPPDPEPVPPVEPDPVDPDPVDPDPDVDPEPLVEPELPEDAVAESPAVLTTSEAPPPQALSTKSAVPTRVSVQRADFRCGGIVDIVRTQGNRSDSRTFAGGKPLSVSCDAPPCDRPSRKREQAPCRAFPRGTLEEPASEGRPGYFFGWLKA
jgi:hypothetical protein